MSVFRSMKMLLAELTMETVASFMSELLAFISPVLFQVWMAQIEVHAGELKYGLDGAAIALASKLPMGSGFFAYWLRVRKSKK